MIEPYSDASFHELLRPDLLETTFYEYRKKRGLRPGRPDDFTGTPNPTREEIHATCVKISNQVLSGEYVFHPFYMRTIEKNTIKQRVVGMARISDLLIQKALAGAIHQTIEWNFKKYPAVDHAVCSHRKGKSAQYAVLQIRNFIKAGYVYGLQTDIVRFYDSIPKSGMSRCITELFGHDTLTSRMLISYINTGLDPSPERTNSSASMQGYADTASGEYHDTSAKGIPVGGVLSGMLSNLYLLDLDAWIVGEISKEYNIRYIRYVDNLLFLTIQDAGKELTERIKSKLSGMGLALHPSPKTKCIDIRQGNLEYLDFQLSADHIMVGSRNIREFKHKIEGRILSEPGLWRSLVESRKRFVRFINKKVDVILSGHLTRCPRCGGIYPPPKSWIRYFSVITTTTQLHELDKWIRASLARHFKNHHQLRLKRKDFRNAGLASLVQEYHRIQNSRLCKCPPVREFHPAITAGEGHAD